MSLVLNIYVTLATKLEPILLLNARPHSNGAGVTFKWRKAAILAHLSELVYSISHWNEEERAKAVRECKKWIAEDPLSVEYVHSDKDNKNADNAALIVSTSTCVYLIFRGTVSKTNWRQNFHMPPRAFRISSDDVPAGKVHGGFLDAHNSLWTKLAGIDCLRPQNGPEQRSVYVSGHSLGGAMAIITAARLVKDRGVKRIDGVYTFGSPGMFDHVATAQYREHPVLKGRTFRVKYKRDAVPKLLSMVYSSPGAPVRLTERDGMTVEARRRHDTRRLAEGVSSVHPVSWIMLTGAETVKTVKAHHMRESYLATIDFMADQAEGGALPE